MRSLEVGGFDMKRALTLVDIATSLSDYAEAIHWLSRCAEAAPGDEARADLQHQRDTLRRGPRDPAAAAIHLNKELDLAPTRLESFAILDATLTGHRDWRGLERAYRKMLERALTEDDSGREAPRSSSRFIATSAKSIGPDSDNSEHAIAAFEAAIGYRPGAIDVREILIGLYHDVRDGDDKRIPHLKALISAQPARFDRYRHLFNVLVADKRVTKRGASRGC